MFINVTYKDAPELSLTCRRLSTEPDPAVEKTLLVNPNCPVRIMLEYIRKQCKLGSFTVFDLCDESGCLMGLFNLDTFAYATDRFEHKRIYYVIVMKTGSDRRMSVLPQLNQENLFYPELKQRVKSFLLTNNSPCLSNNKVLLSSPTGKTSPPTNKAASPTNKTASPTNKSASPTMTASPNTMAKKK